MERTAYFRDCEGRFIPDNIINDARKLSAYLFGYGAINAAFPEPTSRRDERVLDRMYAFGESVRAQVTRNPDLFKKNEDGLYYPPELREPEPLIRLDDGDLETEESKTL